MTPSATPPPRRASLGPRQTALLASFGALIAFGCLLRFWKLGEDGFWYDELWTVVGASGRPFTEMMSEWALGDPHPPGYYLLYFAWLKLVPNDELWARLPNAVAGAVTVIYLLLGTRRVLTRDERIFGAALASFSYLYVFYSVNVKQYSAVLLLTTVATVSYLEIVRDRRLERRAEIALAATTVGLAYLNHFALAYACVLLALLAFTFRGVPLVLRPLRRVAIVLAVAYLPIAYFLYFALLYSGNTEQSRLGTLMADALPNLFFDDRTFVAVGLVLLALALIGRGTQTSLRSARNRHILLIIGTFAAVLLALSLVAPIFTIRYFIVLFPASLLGLAILTAAAFPISIGWWAILPLAFFARGAVVDFRAVDSMQRQEWDTSVDLVLAASQPGDPVYVLGANTDRTMLDYLVEGDVDRVVYLKNLPFYEYYFRRRGADEVANRLRVVEPYLASARALIHEYRQTGKTVFILGGHHIQFDEESWWALQQAASSVQTKWLYSTVIYKLTF